MNNMHQQLSALMRQANLDEDQRYVVAKFSLQLDDVQVSELVHLFREDLTIAGEFATNLQRKQQAIKNRDEKALHEIFQDEDLMLVRMEMKAS